MNGAGKQSRARVAPLGFEQDIDLDTEFSRLLGDVEAMVICGDHDRTLEAFTRNTLKSELERRRPLNKREKLFGPVAT